ncbi:MAG: hypothetical protein L0Y35_02750, partial [Flammeovirgaceae bacterium]|nr:hypothetical protein [Flammeovirgaceae bacterium]
MKRLSDIVFLILISLLLSAPVMAQKKVKLKQANSLSGGIKEGVRFDRLIGNVILTQNKTTIYCDSAHFYKSTNQVEAFGRVRITEGDSITITANKLEYDGNLKRAKLRNNVVFTRLERATLFTDYLDFDRPNNTALYFNGGRLVDTINVLTSRKGYYNVNTNLASFKKDVDVKNPDYTMAADSLQYNSRSKIIYFVSKTTLIDKDSNVFVYESGQYDSKTRKSDLSRGVAENEGYKLESDDYSLDDIRKIYRLRGNVVMTSKLEKLIIYGQASDAYKTKGITKIYDRAYVAKITDDEDTLFMRADTLVSIDDKDPKKKRILAYHNVRIFKSDLQGIADSLEYRSADSTIFFYKNPVLWTQGNQMTADSISMLILNNTINKIFMDSKAFVISTDTLKNFNQIKGRKMVAEFAGKGLKRVVVTGNGESLYFALEDKTNLLMGMNKILCSNMVIRFKEGRVTNLSFYVKPEANFIPPHEIKLDDKELSGFEWVIQDRPTKEDVVSASVSERKLKAKPVRATVNGRRRPDGDAVRRDLPGADLRVDPREQLRTASSRR